MENDQEYMKELYERFRNEISQGSQPGYYDREELLDIYDYAQDEADVMTQMYVFLVAARLYPDADTFLGERIGFFVSYLDSRAGIDMLRRAGRPDTPLWDVLAIGVKHYPNGDPSEDLDALLKKHSGIDSESVIKMIDLLREMQRPDLLMLHMDDFRQKVEDKQGFIYEAAETFRLSGEAYLDVARVLAEELTENEPFNIDNWILLAKVQLQLHDTAEAISAADYAAAINPDFMPVRILRALAMAAEPETRQTAIEELESIIQTQPDDNMVLHGLAEAYRQTGQKVKAGELYLRMWGNDVSNYHDIMTQVFSLGVIPELSGLLAETLYTSLGEDEARYTEAARILMAQNLDAGAIFVLEQFQQRFSLTTGTELLLGLYYKLRRYDDIVTFFKNAVTITIVSSTTVICRSPIINPVALSSRTTV